jgi:hypothetical protein
MKRLIAIGVVSCSFAFTLPTGMVAAQPPEEGDALIVYSAGLEAIAPDAKDAGLVRALRLLEDRVIELPGETGWWQLPAPAIRLALELLLGPMSVQAGILRDVEVFPPIYAQLNFYATDAAAAAERAGRFAATLAGVVPIAFQPAPDHPGMNMLDADGVLVYHGSGQVGRRHALIIALNRVTDQSVQLGRLDLPEGVRPTFALVFDAQQVQPLLEMLGIDDEEALAQLRLMGLLGPDASRISLAIGHSADEAHMGLRYGNYGRILKQSGMMPEAMLSAGDLRRVPADATYAQLTRMDYSAVLRMFEQMLPDAEDIEEMFAEIEASIGIHPQRDVFDHLGQVAGIYMSDSTGSGGLLSMAAFVEAANPEALGETISRVQGMANQAGQQFARGYVRLDERTMSGRSMVTLTFPGLPVPLEISFALAEGYLYAAVSPQGLLAAIEQGAGGGLPGLMDNPRFMEMGGRDAVGAMQVTFYDTPRMLRSGYGLASLVTAALANAVRSPADPARDPGLVMPSYRELADGVKAAMYIARFDGDDPVTVGRFDRSWLVLGTGTAGMIGGVQGLAMTALAAGVTLPALGKARENATVMKSQVQLRSLYSAIAVYTADNHDRLPESVDVLIQENYITRDLLISPFGPMWDGDDFIVNLSLQRFSDSRRPDQQVLAYDRAMYATRGRTTVLYYDGHIEQMAAADFRRLIEEPPNASVEFMLPW